jgi:hypothetical protein
MNLRTCSSFITITGSSSRGDGSVSARLPGERIGVTSSRTCGVCGCESPDDDHGVCCVESLGSASGARGGARPLPPIGLLSFAECRLGGDETRVRGERGERGERGDSARARGERGDSALPAVELRARRPLLPMFDVPVAAVVVA